MRRRRPRISILVCALALITALAGCGGGDQESGGNGLEKSSITVGVLPVVDFVALWVAQDKGLFAKHGLKVKFEVQSGGATAVPRLAAGSLDFSIINYVSAIQATQTGTVPLRILQDAYVLKPDTSGVLVPGDSPIKTPADLAGKKIAVNTKANVGELLTAAGLAANGGRLDTENLAEVEFPQMVAALKSGSVDAVWCVEPFVTAVKRQADGRLVLDTGSGPAADFPIGSYTTTQRFAEENPRTTAAFTAAIREAQGLVAKDPELVRRTLPTYSKIDKPTAEALELAEYPTTLSRDRAQKVADLMLRYGYLKSRFDVTPMIG